MLQHSDVIGVMATRHLNEQGCVDLLTSNERLRWEAIRNEERRKGWLGGRLAAKYQFIAALGGGATDAGSSWRPRLCSLDAALLEDFPRWAYREIEVLPPPCTRVGAPQLSWIGCPQSVCVSLSHTAGLTCACLTDAVPVWLDVEIPRRRDPAFYRGNFSRSERRWAETLCRSESVDPDRVYTLLWCLKEAALKSRRSAEVNVLQVPLIEIQPICPASALSGILRPGQPGTALLNAQVKIRHAGRIGTAEAAIAASAQAILVALRVQEED